MDVELLPPSPPAPAPASDEQLLARCPVMRRKKPTFDAATPSNFCHVCSRTASRPNAPGRVIQLLPCAALRDGHCRKVVCSRCFDDFPLGCTFAEASRPGAEWLCVHCQGACPDRAQCRTYRNVNRRLKLQRLRHQAKKGGVASPASKPQPKAQPIAQPEDAAPRTRRKAQRQRSTKEADLRQSHREWSASPDLEAHDRSAGMKPDCEGEQLPSAVSEDSSAHTVLSNDVYRATSSVATAPAPSENVAPALSEFTILTCQSCDADQTAISESFRKCAGTLDPACMNTFCSSCMRTTALQWSSQVAETKGERWNCFQCTGTYPPHYGERKVYTHVMNDGGGNI